MTKTGWIGLVVIVVAIIGGILWWSSNSAPAQPSQETAAVPAQTQSSGATMPSEQPADAGSPADQAAVSGPADNGSAPNAGAPMSATVTYDGNNFSPSNVSIAAGGTVTFTDTAGQMWVASGQHPTHTLYDGTSREEHCAPGYTGAKPFDQCGSGSTFSFTFTKTGTFSYHDHLNAGAQGTVTVVAAQ